MTFPNHVAGDTFSADEYSRRYGLVDELMGKAGLSAIIFHGSRSPGDIHYLSNWIPSMESYLLWPSGADPVLFIQLFNHVPQARDMSIIEDVRFGGSNARGGVDTTGSLVAAIRDKGVDRGRIGLAGSLPYRHYDRLRTELSSAEFVDVTADMKDIRTIRSDEEFDRIARAAALSDRAIAALQESAKPGMTELDLGRIVDDAQTQDGGYTTLRHIVSTSMGSPRQCVPSKYLTDRVLNVGDVFVVELSAGWGGYSGQVLRTYTVGQGPTPQFERLHDATMATYAAARAAICDGAAIEDLLDAVDIVDSMGFSICDDLIHGANQFPPILRTWQTSHGVPRGFTFREGMAVVVQPNLVTRDGTAGVQYGQMLRVTRSGVDDLHQATHGLLMSGMA